MPRKGEVIKCERCGVAFTVKVNGRVKYCDECRVKVRREQSKAFNEIHGKEYINSLKHKKKVEPTVKPYYTLSDVCAAARKHNMTYGRYVAAWREGLVPPPEKLPPKKKKRS